MSPIFFPQPHFDEIVYSVIARYHHISGNYTNSDSTKDLFNTKHIVPSVTLPTKLGVLVNNTERFGIDFETLLFENTMFPYLMVFSQPENYERVYQWIKSSDNRSDQFAIGTQLTHKCPPKMMFCSKCYEEETLLLGEGYWHRMHQTPGIVVCEKHHCSLSSSIIPFSNQRSANYQILDERTMQLDSATLKYFDSIHNYEIYSDTKFIYNNFFRIRKLFSDFNYCFRDAFLPELIRRQLAYPSGRLKTKAFEEAFICFYGGDYLNSIGLSISKAKGNKWLIKLCRENSSNYTYALEYILLSRFLFGSLENFIYETESS